jgi:hypothetical protein
VRSPNFKKRQARSNGEGNGASPARTALTRMFPYNGLTFLVESIIRRFFQKRDQKL